MNTLSPTNQNYPQAILYHAGVKKLQGDTAELSPAEVRRTGMRSLAIKAAIGASLIGGMVGSGELLGYAIDNSPTTKYQMELQQQQATTGAQAASLPATPNIQP
jgi:hypothetical protein